MCGVESNAGRADFRLGRCGIHTVPFWDGRRSRFLLRPGCAGTEREKSHNQAPLHSSLQRAGGQVSGFIAENLQLIEEYAGVISLAGGKSQSGGFSANMMLDYDRGYADGTVDLNNDKVLDPDKAAGFLCEVCLNKILPAQADRCFGIGAVNLATKQIRVFEGQLGGFTLGDFHIDYHLRDAGSEQQMDILVFYCPVRYQNITSELKGRK